MDFSKALVKMKEGKAVHRSGWCGEGIFIFLVKGLDDNIDDVMVKYHPHITDVAKIVPWIVPQKDLLADDWELY